MSYFIKQSVSDRAQKYLSLILSFVMVFQAFGPGLFALQIVQAEENTTAVVDTQEGASNDATTPSEEPKEDSLKEDEDKKEKPEEVDPVDSLTPPVAPDEKKKDEPQKNEVEPLSPEGEVEGAITEPPANLFRSFANTVDTLFAPDPKIHLEKTSSYDTSSQKVTYTISWSIEGEDIKDFTITDTLPAWVDGIVGTISPAPTPALSDGDLNYDNSNPTDNRTIVWDLGTGEEGTSGEITFQGELWAEEVCDISPNTVSATGFYGENDTPIDTSASSKDIEIQNERCNEPEPPENFCALPQGGDSDVIFGESTDSPSVSLQDILDDEYGNIDAVNDQTGYSLWSIDNSIDSISFTATMIEKIAYNKNIFGYYLNGDMNSFVPIFEVPRTHSMQGDTETITLNTLGVSEIAFAIQSVAYADNSTTTHATEVSETTGSEDHAVVYNPADSTFVMGFEDTAFSTGDEDYQDMVVEVEFTDCTTREAVECVPGKELIKNGSFEDPEVTDPVKWDVFTSGLEWFVEWLNNPVGAPDTASLELHEGVNGWLAADGDQYAELDGDWGGPGHGGNEDASTLIYQDISTVPGETYTLKFSFKPRPNANTAGQNILAVLWQGNDIDVLDESDTNGDWTEFSYSFTADNSGLSRIQFEDRGTSDAMGTFIDNVSLVCEEPKEDREIATIVASKIVCTDESDLPNWGAGTSTITSTLAEEWVNTHDSCEFASDWEFQWAPDGVADPDDGAGELGSPWTTFGPTVAGVTSVEVPLEDVGDRIWVREVFKDGYIPFTGQNTDQDVSAEIYCHEDALHYDNWDFVQSPEEDETYYCVAWNVPTELPEPCVEGPTWADTVISSEQGKRKDGSNVLPARSTPGSALGANDGVFFSLGKEGKITLKFNHYVENVIGNDLSFHETTNGTYPLETASVEVSQDNINWFPIGSVSNSGGTTKYLDFDSTGLDWIQYVRITDTTDFSLHTNDADGYDLDAVDATNGLCEEPKPEPTLELATVTMCKVDDEQNYLPNWQLMLRGALVENLSVDSTNAAGVPSSILDNNQSYLVRASGTFLAGDGITGDAKYSIRVPNLVWTDDVQGYESEGPELLDLQIDGNSVGWGAYNGAHVYWTSLVGASTSALFTINDIFPSNNEGSLSVDIYEGYTGITEGNGCVVFTDVPYGDYTADEILQDGWTMVSGTGDVTIGSPEVTITIVNEQEDGDPDPEDPKHTSELIIVNPDDMKGWAFAEESATGNGSMVTGPITTPRGVGSANLIVNDTGGEVLGVAYPETRLDAITHLQYSTYRALGGPALAIALQFNVDADLTDADESWQGRLVYEPYHTKTVNTGVWETWNPMDNDAAGNWWFSNGTLAGNTGCSQANPCTWNEVLTALPDGGIHSTLGGVLFKAGSGWVGGFDGNVDELVITVKTGLDTHTTTYDFEPITPTTTSSTSGDNDSSPSRRSQRILGATDDNSLGEVAGATTDLPGLPNTGNGEATGASMALLALILAFAGINFVGVRKLRKS